MSERDFLSLFVIIISTIATIVSGSYYFLKRKKFKKQIMTIGGLTTLAGFFLVISESVLFFRAPHGELLRMIFYWWSILTVWIAVICGIIFRRQVKEARKEDGWYD